MSDAYQKQKAGDNSTQIQGGTVIVNMGIDEKRVREICDETFQVARRDMTAEAYEIASQRVTQFEDDFVPKFQKVEGALNALRDPAFQFTLTSAHKTAASTDRYSDYEVLSELLIHRVERKDDRIKTAGINRAIEIVDNVSDDALTAITVAFVVEKLLPLSNNIVEGLNDLDTLLGKLCHSPLPQGQLWMDHLDILDVIRVNYAASLKKLEICYAEIMPHYCSTGIEVNSESFKEAQTILAKNNLLDSLLVPHELNPEYVRLPVLKESDIDALYPKYIPVGKNIQVQLCNQILSESQKKALHEIYALYATDTATIEKFKELFCSEISKHANLKMVQEWWNSIPSGFGITPVGSALAYANAKRCAPEVPPID